MENQIGVGDLGSTVLSDLNAQKFGTMQDTVDALNALPESGRSSPAQQAEAQFAADNSGTDSRTTLEKLTPNEKPYPKGMPMVYPQDFAEDVYMMAHGNVRQKFDATLSLYRRQIENAVKGGQAKIGNIPTSDYATFCAWRQGDIEIDEGNAKRIFPALMSVVSNGEVRDDYDGSFFMSWQKLTDDRTHELTEGFTQTSSVTGENPRIKWDTKATADGFKRYFDTLEAGDVAMRNLANERLLEKDIGLKPGEDYYAKTHEEQVAMCKRAVPFYSDLSQLQNIVQGAFNRVRDTDVACESNDAGRYILKRIVEDGDTSRLPSWQQGVVSAYLSSSDKRSAAGLAEWMRDHKGELDAAYSEHLKERNERIQLEQAMNPVGVGGHALVEILQDNLGFDELSVVEGEGGKATLAYKAGGITDREFVLKGKVIDDLIDADVRYSAQRAMQILNENPGAWAFVRRWVDGMHGTSPTPSSFSTVTSRDAKSATYGLMPLFGDREGAFTMMMDYLYEGGDEKTVKAAMEAFSLIDNRMGAYASGKDASRAYAGTLNAVDSGVIDFITKSATWAGEMVGIYKDAADYAAEWCAKHQGADEAEWMLNGKHLYEAMANADAYRYFNDNTIAGGALEFYLNIKTMGGLFGASTKAVGGGLMAVGNLGKGLEKAADVAIKVGGMSRKVENVALAVGEIGARIDPLVSKVAPLSKWLAVGGMSPEQAKVADSLKAMRATRVKNLVGAMKKGDAAVARICTENIAKCDQLAAGIFKNFNAYKSATERVAEFVAKIPGAAYFYDTAKGQYEGAYLMQSDDWSLEQLQRNERFATAQGFNEGLLMAGALHLYQGNRAFTANAIKALRAEAQALDAEVEKVVSGAFIPGGKDAMKALARNVILQRAWESCRKAWVENAMFMFTLEEAKAITDNCKTIADMKAQDPDYKPDVWDYVCDGQGAAITETLKVANTTALLGLAGGAYATAKNGKGRIGPSQGQMEKIAKSRVTLAEGKIAEKVGDAPAAEAVAKFLYDYADANKQTRKGLRDGIRKQFGEDAARLLEQAAFEVEKSRTDFGARTRGGFSVAKELYAAQDMTPDSVKASLSKLVSGDGVSLDKMPDGSLRVKLAKGTKIGDFTLDADRTVIVKTSNMKGLNSKIVDGKTVYDPAWCSEIIAKYREGTLKGEFKDALDKFLAKQMSDGQREKKLAKLAAGENIEKLLSLANETLTNAGIYIPKTDPRFGKALGGADANLVDGILMLADVTDSAKTPNRGLGAAEDAAVRKGQDVKTFLHEYLHAIVDMLPIEAERKAQLAEAYGDKPWQEGIVDNFLDAHTDRIAAQRAAKFRAMAERGVLQTVADAAKRVANAFGIKTKADEDFEAEGEKSAIKTFVDMLTRPEAKTEVDTDGEVVDKTEVDRRIDKTKKQILGGSFRVVSKEELTGEALRTMRMSVYKNGGLAIDPMDYERIDALADNWLHKDVYPGRYPRSVFRSFDRKADGTLAKSIIVTSLNSTNQSETSGGVAKMTSLMVCAGLDGRKIRDFVIERKGKLVKGTLNGYDPETCLAWGGDGYVKLDALSRDALMLQAREVQEANVRIWAKDNDVWFNGIDAVAKELGYRFNEELNGGVESRVWADAKRGKVVKHLWNMDVSAGGDINKTLDRIVLFNSLFPESRMRLLGWGEVDGKFGAFIEQPYFVGGLDVKAEEVDALMAERGFKRIEDPEFHGGLAYASEDGSTVVRDVNEGGVIRNVDGSLSVIDAICTLNTKQNAIDGVVPVDGKGFKGGTYGASWSVGGGGERIADIVRRIEESVKSVPAEGDAKEVSVEHSDAVSDLFCAVGDRAAKWNVVGQRSFAELLGPARADVAAKIAREEFRKAFDALESDEARDARKRIMNDEVNRYLESRKSNVLDLDLDGEKVAARFYRGGADSGVRYEYGGTSAVIPRNFKKALTKLREDGSLPDTFLKVGDFYKKDPLLGMAATTDNASEVLKGVADARVFVKGTPAWRAYSAHRTKQGQTKTEPLFVNGVGVNGYGDVVIDAMGDNRTIARKMNMAVVKLMQRFEGWETPLDASSDVSFFRRSDLGGKEDADSFNFGINSQRLRDFVGQAVNERLADIERGKLDAQNLGRSFDYDELVRKVEDAIASCVQECAEHFNSEIEAKALGARFGVDVEKLPSYSDMQKAVVDGLIKPFNRSGLTAAMNSRNVVKFYRDTVLNAVAKLLPTAHMNDRTADKRNLRASFMKSVRDCYREIIARYVEDAGGIEEAALVRENLFLAKDYKAGGTKGENAENTIAQQSDVAEGVQQRLDREGYQRAAYGIVKEALTKGVGAGKGVKEILSAPELRKTVYDSIIDSMRRDGGEVGIDAPLAKKYVFDAFTAALTDFARETSAQFSVVSDAGGRGKYNQIVRMLWAENALKRSNARLRVERRDLKDELHGVKRTAQRDLATKDREIRDAKAEAERAKYLAERQVAGAQRQAFEIKAKSDEFREKYGAMAEEKRRLEKRVANADANRVKASRIRNAEGLSPAEVVEAFGGKDMVDALVNAGAVGDGKTPMNAGRFANEMAVEFAITYRDRSAEYRDMPISEFFSNPIVAAEFANTVASWLKHCARKCAYGRVRSAAERDAAALRRLLRPNFLTVKGVLEENVRKMVDLRQRMEANRIVENVRKTLNRRARANKAVDEQTQEFRRLVDPLHQEYWKQVGKCLDMTPEEVAAEIESLKAKHNITDAELGWAAEKPATEGLKELTAEQVRDRRAALLRVAALSRYGAMKYLPVGELGDKVDEISHDIETSRKRFDWLYGERTKADGEVVEAFVVDLAKARADKTGAANLELGRSAKMWRGALYYCVPDLFLRMKMFFPKGSAAYEMCENFRREMSLAHIEEARMAEVANRQFVDTMREIYGGMEFDEILRDLMTPHAEWSKYSRRDWDAEDGASGITLVNVGGRLCVKNTKERVLKNGKVVHEFAGYTDYKTGEAVEVSDGTSVGKEHTVKLAKMGAKPNRTKSADGLSKAQLMYIYAACSQGDMAINNIVYGRDATYFREIAEIVGPEGLAVVKWMRQQFENQRKAMSPVCEAITGMPIVSPTADYFPLKFEQDTSDPTDARRRYSAELFPSFLKTRENHGASRLDDRLDVFHVFNERLHGASHYIAFAEIIDRVRTTFCDSRVQTAYAKTIGTEAFREMYTQMATALNGGVPDQIRWLSELRNFTTASTLFYNIPSAIKQFEGIGGWSAEMGLGHWLKSLGRFMRSTKEARDAAADIDRVIETRKVEGFSDVARALKDSIDAIERGGGKMYNIYQSYKRHGLTLTTFIDTLASRSLAGAFYSQKFAYYRSIGDSEAEAKRKAIADVDYAIQTTQQSSRPEFLIGAQRGDGRSGEFGKLFAQFAGPAYVRLGMELEALHRYVITSEKNGATKEQVRDARKAFINKAVALHVVCPAILTALEMLGKALTHNEDDWDYVRDCAMSFARNVITGPFAGMFVLGSYIESASGMLIGANDKRSFAPTVPMMSRLYSVMNKTKKAFDALKDSCFDDLDAEGLLDATLKTFEAVLPPLKHGENAIRNVREMLD